MNRANTLTSHQRASSKNRRPRQVAQQRASGTTGPAVPQRVPLYAPEVFVATVFRIPIFRRNQCNDLARPAIDAAMTPDSSTALRTFIVPRPSQRPRCTMLPRFVVADGRCHAAPPWSPRKNTRRPTPSHQSDHMPIKPMNVSKDDAPTGVTTQTPLKILYLV